MPRDDVQPGDDGGQVLATERATALSVLVSRQVAANRVLLCGVPGGAQHIEHIT